MLIMFSARKYRQKSTPFVLDSALQAAAQKAAQTKVRALRDPLLRRMRISH